MRRLARPKKNIETNTDDLISQLMEAITDTYLNPPENTADENGRMYLNLLAEEFSMTPIKVRKLLISSGVYQTDISMRINELYKSGKTIKEIQKIVGLSAASVSGYLPYQKTVYNARTFENQISGGLKSTSQGISKSNANDNYINNTYFSDTESIFSERAEPMGERMRQRERYKEMVLENIDYDILKEEPKLDREQLDEIVELMVDTICTTQEYIIIGGDKKPAEVVKSQFLKLDAGHIQFVLDCLKENTSKVRNIRKYLLSVLYNASMTIDNYYSALVNHDLYGG